MSMIVAEGQVQEICDQIWNGVESFNQSYFRNRSIDVVQFVIYEKDEQGNLIGGVCGSVFHNSNDGNWIDIDFAWVDEKHRLKGIGRQLFTRLDLFAKDKTCRYIQLFTWAYQAIGFYQKIGFVSVGTIPQWVEGHDAIFLRKFIVR